MAKLSALFLKRGDILKVPIRYKSSDRYNAGVDVVYDDESKLQYAPFIYATTASGDNGSSGEDEEGEDFMVVKIDSSTGALDKTWKEIYDSVKSGKFVYIMQDTGTEENPSITIMCVHRVDKVEVEGVYTYKVVTDNNTYKCSEENGYPRQSIG